MIPPLQMIHLHSAPLYEMDAETRRKLELRERMAKMSGGMGMAGMFGAVPMGGLPPKKKKASEKKSTGDSEEHVVPQQRMPMFAMPGMPSVRSPESENKQLAVEKEEVAPHPVTQSHAPEEIPDVEDVVPQSMQRTPTAEHPPPVPADSKFLISRKPFGCFVYQTLDAIQSSSLKTVSKTYVAFDGFSEYLMTVSVSSRF